jgi:hypothetical protein
MVHPWVRSSARLNRGREQTFRAATGARSPSSTRSDSHSSVDPALRRLLLLPHQSLPTYQHPRSAAADAYSEPNPWCGLLDASGCALMGYGAPLPNTYDWPQPAEDPAAGGRRTVDNQRQDDQRLRTRGGPDWNFEARFAAAGSGPWELSPARASMVRPFGPPRNGLRSPGGRPTSWHA